MMLKLYSPTVVTSLAAVVIGALSMGASAASISNSVSDNSIIIDANINDWANVASLGYDADTLADVNSQADFLEG